MYGLSDVPIEGDDSAYCLHCSTLASIPTTHLSAKVRDTDASNRIDSSRLRAMTGSMTLSSRLPAAPPNATAASLPTTCATTWHTASAITGLTFPGMIDDPGCRSGRWISPRPARGPDDIHL